MRLKCRENNWNNQLENGNFDINAYSQSESARNRCTRIINRNDSRNTFENSEVINCPAKKLHHTGNINERITCDINCCDNQTIGDILDNLNLNKLYSKRDHIQRTLSQNKLEGNLEIHPPIRGNINWFQNGGCAPIESMSSTSEDGDERTCELSDCETPICDDVCVGGITNPNYPGFQHFAQTFQDYGSPVIGSNYSLSKLISQIGGNEQMDIESSIDVDKQDLIANCSTIQTDVNCNIEIDSENNIKSIIGDFDKEIKSELSHIFTENVDFEEDIKVLRRDISENFREPIENTINNISDVVNNVIRQLVNEKSFDDKTFLKDNKDISFQKTEVNEISKISNAQNYNVRHSESNDNLFTLKMNKPNALECSYLKAIIPAHNKVLNQSKSSRDAYTKRITCTANTTCKKNYKNNITLNKESENSNKELNSKKNTQRIHPILKREFTEQQTKANLKENQPKALAAKTDGLDSFDVYNIETAMPVLDLDAIESHLKAAKEAERKKKTDREEIRKRLALGLEYDEYVPTDRPGRKPSLHSRLQNGKNLQICYMNEVATDVDNITLESDKNDDSFRSLNTFDSMGNPVHCVNKYHTKPLSVSSINKEKSAIPQGGKIRPASLALKSKSTKSLNHIDVTEKDFFAVQARLQTEARIELAQAKEKARLEMERSRRIRPASPVTGMVRTSLAKANCSLPETRRRLSRQFLTNMNIAQLQVIVNELHSQIEVLNDSLVHFLMARDELHMTQDSRLVDIEDLTRYLEVKQQGAKVKPINKSNPISSIIRPVK